MLIKALLAISLTLPVSINQYAASPLGDPREKLSYSEKLKLLRPLENVAATCLINTVLKDQRLPAAKETDTIADVVMDAFIQCGPVVRELAREYNRLIGFGEGDDFVVGDFATKVSKTLTSILYRQTGP